MSFDGTSSLSARLAERLLFVAGSLALVAAAASWGIGHARAREDVRQVLEARARRDASGVTSPGRAARAGAPDFQLWSPTRVAFWQAAQVQSHPPPLGILRIQRLGLEAPILEGTDDDVLNRGVGHIDETAAPGAAGNTGIAGHRDSFFRVLKDIGAGDQLEIETTTSTATYRVDRTWIVTPDDVSVLDPTNTPSVTLVTCFPFYFVGSAPQRFIVRASLVAGGGPIATR